MKCKVEGLIHVTGAPDCGKTTFAYTAGPSPDKICFLDNDIKGKALHSDLNFGMYRNLVREFTEGKDYKPIAFFNLIMGILDTIKPGQFEVIIFDNFTQLEAGIADFAEAHIGEMSNITPGQVKNMSQLTWPAKRIMYGRVLDAFLEKAPTVILTTHLKDKWVGNIRTEAQIPQCQKPLTEKASLRIWLRHNPNNEAPIGLVLKRISKSIWDEKAGKIIPVSVLPRKLDPCTWDVINHYIDNPLEERVASTPNEFEMGILDGILTEDQRMMLRAALDREQEAEFETAQQEEETQRETILQLKEDGMSIKDIAKRMGMTVPMVRGLM